MTALTRLQSRFKVPSRSFEVPCKSLISFNVRVSLTGFKVPCKSLKSLFKWMCAGVPIYYVYRGGFAAPPPTTIEGAA